MKEVDNSAHPFNNLSEAELERLAILAEECSEVIQIVNKIIRHGYESYNPFDESKTTNRHLLEKELGDLEFACRFMLDNNDASRLKIAEHASTKMVNIRKYLHHNTITLP